jgi:endonuclease/exonuclease/phosphatase family metal-dependent hydrolase
MADKEFTPSQWADINTELNGNTEKYGLPTPDDKSILLASFNIRKLGQEDKRDDLTWKFLARICRHFDLIAVQEIQDDLSGLQRLKREMGDDFGLVITDTTGTVPGSTAGMIERLGIIFNWKKVQRTEIASDIAYDRAEVINMLYQHKDAIWKAFEETKDDETPKSPVFLTFIRTPQIVSFRVVDPEEKSKPYEFMLVNAHLVYGDSAAERDQEFEALAGWLKERARLESKAYYPNFILLGDLNLETDSQTKVLRKIIQIKKWNQELGTEVEVNFPLLDPHKVKGQQELYRTNARKKSTFDQIGLFFKDRRFPSYKVNESKMGTDAAGPDYGVFDYVDLFSTALGWGATPDYGAFEHNVSDHLPIWIRLPVPYRSMHIVDMTGERKQMTSSGEWQAKVTLTVQDIDGNPVDGSKVGGVWKNANQETMVTSKTGQKGKCTFTSHTLGDKEEKINFTVTQISKPSSDLKYHSASNHDTLTFSFDIHVDLYGDSVIRANGKWDAKVTVTAHDSFHKPVENARIKGKWSTGSTITLETDANGHCVFSSSELTKRGTTFTITGVAHTDFIYDASKNHSTNHPTNKSKFKFNKPSGP